MANYIATRSMYFPIQLHSYIYVRMYVQYIAIHKSQFTYLASYVCTLMTIYPIYITMYIASYDTYICIHIATCMFVYTHTHTWTHMHITYNHVHVCTPYIHRYTLKINVSGFITSCVHMHIRTGEMLHS